METKHKGYKTVVLDEVEHLTNKAQIILKELIDKYNNNTRFIFICNNPDNINKYIKIQFKLLKYDKINNLDIKNYLNKICKHENMNPTECGIDSLILISDGDIRLILNTLDYISILYSKFNKQDIYNIFNIPPPELILNIFNNYRNKSIIYIITEVKNVYLYGYSFSDIIHITNNIIYNIISNMNSITDKNRIKLITEIGNIHVRNNNGNKTLLQLSKFFCYYYLLII